MRFPRYVVAARRLLAAGRRFSEQRVLIGVALVVLLGVAVLVGWTSFATAQGCTDSWASASTGSWDTPSNWSTGKVPISSDTVCISASGNSPYSVIVGNETIEMASLTVGGTGSEPTLMIGNASAGGTAEVDISGGLDIASTGTVTVAAPLPYDATLTLGSVTNAGTFSVLDDVALTLPEGSTFENAGGRISNSSGTFTISSPSGQTGSVELDSGGVVENSGSLTVSDTLDVNGGSICGNALHFGNGNGSGALAFPATPGTGPACEVGLASDDITLLDTTTLSGTIPASYTLAAGGAGVAYGIVLSGDVVNDGTLEPGVGNYAGTLTAADSSDYLTNNGTVNMQAGGTFDTSLINNSTFNIEGSQNNVPVTASLQNGSSWQNTNTGKITIRSGDTLDISSPSGSSAGFVQDGVIDNSGIFNVADPITVNGGTICGASVNLGLGDTGASAGETLTLTFAASPVAGPACASGQASNQLYIYNVTATIESDIPAGYTLAMGNVGSGSAAVSTPGNLVNNGTLELEWGMALTIGSSGTDTLTNPGTIEVPALGAGSAAYIDSASIQNTSGTVLLTDDALLTTTGSYTQGAQGTFTAQLDGTSALNGYGQLQAAGGSTLAGTLDIDTVSGFSPTTGNTFEIIKGGTVSGAFATILGQYPPGDNSAYGVSYDPSDVTLTVSGQSTTSLTVSDIGNGSGTVSSAPAGIDCGSTCVAGFPQNQNVTLTETPASGSVFTGWSGDCSGSASTCQVTLSAARSVEAQYIVPPNTTTSLQSSAEPSTVGQQVTYTATVSPTPDGGTVVFTDQGSTISGCGSVGVNTSTGVATCAPTYAAVGSHAIKASYSGDTDFGGSQSSSQIQVVDAANTTTTLQSSANPSLIGQQVTYTANVSPTPDGGTVAFTDGRSTISGCGSVTVNTSTGEASCQATYAATGAHTIEASYSGDTNYGGSQTGPFEQVVDATGTSTSLHSSSNPSLPQQQVTYTATVLPTPDGGTVSFTDEGATITGCESVAVNTSTGEASCQATYAATGSHPIEANYSGDTLYGSSEGTLNQVVAANATSTAVVSSKNPSLPGQQVTYTATVSPVPDGGTLEFTDNGTAITGCETVTVNTSTGEASCQATYDSSGSHTIVANYSGDTLYSSSHGGLNQVVSSTSTSLSSSANPSLPEQEVTYTATVSPTPDGGTIAFTDNGSAISGCEAVTLNTSTGEASCRATYPSVDTHPIVASYSGDQNYAGSESSTLNQVVATNATSTAVLSSKNPSLPGQEVTYTATVSPTPDGGTMEFTDNGTAISGCESVPVNTSTGVASCQVTYTSGGSHSIEAEYSGDTLYGPSHGNLTQVVSSTSTALQSSANPSLPEQQVTYTATVSPVPDGGTVAFTDGGSTISGCGSVAVNTSTGQASCQQTYPATGSHQIQALYSGNAHFASSESATLSQTVNAPPVQATTMTVTASPNPYYTLFTAVDTFTATISPVPDGGNVAFTANGVPICYYAAVNSSGQATCTGLSLYDFGAKFGPLTIQATYAGDARFNGAQASTVLNYDGYPSKLLLSASPSPGSVGQPVTYSATVNAQLAVEGTVTLTENGKAIPGCSLTVNGFGGTSGCSVTYNSIATHTIVANFTSLAGNYDGDTSSTVTESVEAAAPTKTVQPAQATITTPPCPNGYTCGAIAAPLPVPPTVLFGCQLATVPGVPAVSARKEDWAANVDDPSATATRNSTPVAPILIPKVPVGPVLAAVIANDVQAAQTALESVPVSALRQAGPTEEPTVPVNPCGAVGGRAAAKPSSAPTSPSTKTYLGPPAASVLAAIYKTHPSRDDVSAFLDEVLLAESKTSSPVRALARYVLTDAVKLGEATLAYQFHDKRLRQLKLSHVRIGSVHARGHGHLLTIKPNVLGARVLRLLEVLGLAHRVSIQLTLSERAHGHIHIIRRTIKVL